MSKKMLINASHPEENRVAIVVDGVLSELDIEIAGQEQSKGNIYKAVVVRVETGLQAAFVDYGAEKLGFLQIGEIHPNLYPPKDDSKGRPRIADILKRGQEILVQIVKEERGNKGAALTTFLSIPGRYMVLMPDSTTKGVSRKISDDSERKKLKKTMAELDLPERMGYIVRTAGIGKDKDELKRDFDYLVRLFEGITARKDQIKAPSQLYQESNLAIRSIRDYFTTDIDEVLIDGKTVYQDAKDFFSLVMPELSHLVKQHRERRPIFSRYQIEEQIDALAKNQIALPSGGSIVIDQTEALVAIDVNSGKMASESGIEATALKTNLEAAAEVGRQLRLRDLGGLVVIDFIDMRDRKNTREVEQALRKALKNDKAKVSVGRISQFGLLEMSRQRLKPVLSVGSFLPCPHCKGAGKIKSAEAQAVTLLRNIHTAASKGHIAYIDATVPMDVANYLLNHKRKTIVKLEQQLDLEITIYGSSKLLPGDIDVESRKKEKEQDNNHEIAPISHANQIEVALAAQQEEQDVEAVTEKSDVTPEQTDQAAEATQEPPKKKRRRRRRKPSAKTAEGQAQEDNPQDKPEDSLEQGDTPKAAPEEGAPGPAAELPVETTVSTPDTTAAPIATADSQETSTPAEEKKPRRRSRRQPRKKPAQSAAEAVRTETSGDLVEEIPSSGTSSQEAPQTSPAQQPEQPPAALVSEETPQQEEKPEAAAEEKPKRRTRRTSKAKSTSEPAPATALEKATDDTEAEGAAAAEEKPKRRTRKPAAKKQAEAPVDAAAAKTEETAPATETVAEEKPKRRTRRAPAKPKAETAAQASATDETAATTTTTASAETAEAEKPKRRTRRTTAKAKAEPAAEAVGTETPETAVSEEKPKRRTRRTTSKAKTEETTATATTGEQQEAPTSEEKPKRRTRRTTAKAKSTTAAATETPELKPEATNAAAAEEKPKRRTRRAPAKPKQAATAEPTTPTPEAE